MSQSNTPIRAKIKDLGDENETQSGVVKVAIAQPNAVDGTVVRDLVTRTERVDKSKQPNIDSTKSSICRSKSNANENHTSCLTQILERPTTLFENKTMEELKQIFADWIVNEPGEFM